MPSAEYCFGWQDWFRNAKFAPTRSEDIYQFLHFGRLFFKSMHFYCIIYTRSLRLLANRAPKGILPPPLTLLSNWGIWRHSNIRDVTGRENSNVRCSRERWPRWRRWRLPWLTCLDLSSAYQVGSWDPIGSYPPIGSRIKAKTEQGSMYP